MTTSNSKMPFVAQHLEDLLQDHVDRHRILPVAQRSKLHKDSTNSLKTASRSHANTISLQPGANSETSARIHIRRDEQSQILPSLRHTTLKKRKNRLRLQKPRKTQNQKEVKAKKTSRVMQVPAQAGTPTVLNAQRKKNRKNPNPKTAPKSKKTSRRNKQNTTLDRGGPKPSGQSQLLQ